MPENKLVRRVDRQSSVTIDSPDNPFIGNLTIDDDNNGVALVKLAAEGELVVSLPARLLGMLAEVINEMANTYRELSVTELWLVDNPDSAQGDDSPSVA